MNKPINRLNGRFPKIGIRPVIDGRRKGVREALENQTMNMAKSAAEFLTENLKHSNGMPVNYKVKVTQPPSFSSLSPYW